MSHIIKVLGESDQVSFKKNNNCLLKSVWSYAWEVHHGDDFFDKTVHKKISRTEGLIYDIY
jgi:hypothetical protein